MKRYLATTALGFAGMFAAHLLLLLLLGLLVEGLSLKFVPYIITYPLVYTLLVFFLTRNHPAWWLSNTICILLIPFIYWYWLLWSDGKFRVADAIKLGESSGMLLIMPLTFVLTMLVSLYSSRHSHFLPGNSQ